MPIDHERTKISRDALTKLYDVVLRHVHRNGVQNPVRVAEDVIKDFRQELEGTPPQPPRQGLEDVSTRPAA